MYQLTKKKNTALRIAGFVLALSITAEIFRAFFATPSADEQLLKIAEAINKHCPMMVDSVTRLNNSAALPGKKFLLNYTFIKYDKSDIDIPKLQSGMKTFIVNVLKTDPKFSAFRQNHVALSASFYDSSGKYICYLPVEPDEYTK